jgi:RHS repeat-associated protein
LRSTTSTGAEQVLTYPHPAVKLLNGVTPAQATYLHRDGLSSVRTITNSAGVKIESALYKPFGEQSEWLLPGNTAPETKGWIGERFDADAGLQYLNARYYDPELSLFLQPDWFEVTKAGVGTNRFSYSFNDPVNLSDPNGNSWLDRTWDKVFGDGSFNRTFGDSGSSWSDKAFGNSYEKSYSSFHSSLKPQPGYPKSSYPESKRQFYENSINPNGQAASGDAIFDIVGGAGLAKSAIQLGFKGTKALLGGGAATALSIRTVGELGEAAVRAAYEIGPKEMVQMFGRNRFPDGILPEVVSEVKNVAKLSYTRQLRDYAAYAADTGREFHLYVRSATELAGTLVRAIEEKSIILRVIPE